MPAGLYIRTDEIKIKNSVANKGKHLSPMTEFKKGMVPNNKGKSPSEKSRQKMSKSHKGKYIGNEHPNWKGGYKLKVARAHAKRKNLFGFIPLNNPEIDGWVAHHLDYNYVIFMPEELHKSVYHSVIKDINMDIINDKVYEWFVEYYLKVIINGT